jgi:hypothetical protein
MLWLWWLLHSKNKKTQDNIIDLEERKRVLVDDEVIVEDSDFNARVEKLHKQCDETDAIFEAVMGPTKKKRKVPAIVKKEAR